MKNRSFLALAAVTALLVLADAVYTRHAHFSWEGAFGFYAFYALVACVLFTLVTRGLRVLLERRESEYEKGDGDE